MTILLINDTPRAHAYRVWSRECLSHLALHPSATWSTTSHLACRHQPLDLPSATWPSIHQPLSLPPTNSATGDPRRDISFRKHWAILQRFFPVSRGGENHGKDNTPASQSQQVARMRQVWASGTCFQRRWERHRGQRRGWEVFSLVWRIGLTGCGTREVWGLVIEAIYDTLTQSHLYSRINGINPIVTWGVKHEEREDSQTNT